jgi:hypothetical protein
MVQLSALRGQHSGAQFIIDRFPFSIGRSESDLCCEESGVWENHLQLLFDPSIGIVLKSLPDAFTAVNGTRTCEATLRNGDIVEVGGSKFQFTLAPALQRPLRSYEIAAWVFVSGITLAQVLLIYRLLRI